MEVYEITGYQTGVARDRVNYLEPADSFESISNGYIYRGVIQSRQGLAQFAPRLAGTSRVMMIQTFRLTDGTTQLLVADTKYMYRWDVGTESFVQLAFGGQLATDNYTSFNISDPSAYISGTAYPDNLNNSRFVFTSSDMALSTSNSGIFFYDPSDNLIKDFKVDVANGNPMSYYQEPATSIGNLYRAKHVIYFNERLNFISPQTSLTTYKQGYLFSGIRDSSGKGDKFNTPGSGLNQLATYDIIQGASILGDYIGLNLSNSNWILEKTKDAFNPYNAKQIPSVIGTDAPFSFAQWNSRIYSMGRDGILVMGFRESLRTDDKIPYFTRDEIESTTFEYTFGGFDRTTNQFLWTYLDNTSDTTQNKVLAYNYEENSWSTYDMYLTVLGQYDGQETLTWDQIEATTVGGEVIHPEWATWDTTEEIWDQIGLGDKYKVTLAGDNNGFIYQLNSGWDDNSQAITNITNASSAVVSVDTSNFEVGDFVAIEDVEGMTEINNIDGPYYEVTAVTATSVTLSLDTTDYGTYTPTTGIISKPIKFVAVTNPFNPYRDKGLRCFISTIEVLIDTGGGFVYVDVFADGETTPFIQDVLLQPDNTIQKDRQYVSMVIDHEADFFQFKFTQNTASEGVKITSIRFHVEPGGLTNG